MKTWTGEEQKVRGGLKTQDKNPKDIFQPKYSSQDLNKQDKYPNARNSYPAKN